MNGTKRSANITCLFKNVQLIVTLIITLHYYDLSPILSKLPMHCKNKLKFF